MYFGFEIVSDLHQITSNGILIHTMIENKSTVGISFHFLLLALFSRVPKLLHDLVTNFSWMQYYLLKDLIIALEFTTAVYLFEFFPYLKNEISEYAKLRNISIFLVFLVFVLSLYLAQSYLQRLYYISKLMAAVALIPQIILINNGKNKIQNLKTSFVMFLGASRAWNMINWIVYSYYEYPSIDQQKLILILFDLIETVIFYFFITSHQEIRINIEKYKKVEYILEPKSVLETMPSTIVELTG